MEDIKFVSIKKEKIKILEKSNQFKVEHRYFIENTIVHPIRLKFSEKLNRVKKIPPV